MENKPEFPIDPELRKKIEEISLQAPRLEMTDFDLEQSVLDETDLRNGGRKFGGE